jgi:hypothetical protein
VTGEPRRPIRWWSGLGNDILSLAWVVGSLLAVWFVLDVTGLGDLLADFLEWLSGEDDGLYGEVPDGVSVCEVVGEC